MLYRGSACGLKIMLKSLCCRSYGQNFTWNARIRVCVVVAFSTCENNIEA